MTLDAWTQKKIDKRFWIIDWMHCTTNDILLCFMKSSNTTCILEFDTLKIPYELNSPFTIFNVDDIPVMKRCIFS